MNYLGFSERFKNDILNQEKEETLRLKSSSTPDISAGDLVFAVISHTEGPFAVLKIEEKKPITVQEILETDFETHTNYKDLEDFNSSMAEYYSPPFTKSDEFIYYRFSVYETNSEKIKKRMGTE